MIACPFFFNMCTKLYIKRFFVDSKVAVSTYFEDYILKDNISENNTLKYGTNKFEEG